MMTLTPFDVSPYSAVGEVTDEVCKLEATSSALTAQLKEVEKEMQRIKESQEAVETKLKKALSSTENIGPFGPEPIPYEPGEVEEREESFDFKPDFSQMKSTKSSNETIVSILPNVRPIESSNSFEGRFSNISIFSDTTNNVSANDNWRISAVQNRGSPFRARPSDTSSPHRSVAENHPRIDFAIGFSGHRGLNTVHTSTGTPERHVMMMSDHRGVNQIGPTRSFEM